MADKPANQKPQPAPKPGPKPQQQGTDGKPAVTHQLSPEKRAAMIKRIRSTLPDVASFGRDEDGKTNKK